VRLSQPGIDVVLGLVLQLKEVLGVLLVEEQLTVVDALHVVVRHQVQVAQVLVGILYQVRVSLLDGRGDLFLKLFELGFVFWQVPFLNNGIKELDLLVSQLEPSGLLVHSFGLLFFIALDLLEVISIV